MKAPRMFDRLGGFTNKIPKQISNKSLGQRAADAGDLFLLNIPHR
jgi:hypothetical protein